MVTNLLDELHAGFTVRIRGLTVMRVDTGTIDAILPGGSRVAD